MIVRFHCFLLFRYGHARFALFSVDNFTPRAFGSAERYHVTV